MNKLVYTIAQNGYERAFARCIRSQQAYASRIGARFVCVSKPSYVAHPAHSAWLKVPVMLQGLEAGYDAVAYIDADCEVRAEAPDFSSTVGSSGDSVCMALGRSGRFNSGVMFATGDDSARAFFRAVRDSVTQSIPAEDRANLKYENGNIIYIANKLGGVSVLDERWNNTTDPELADFIRHYSGPMKSHYKRSPLDSAHYWLIKRTISRRPPQPEQRGAEFDRSLAQLSDEVATRYPELRSITA